jgi:2-methylcitrate dehydratase PrpD
MIGKTRLTMEELYQLAQFVADTQYETIPGEVMERAHWIMRDTVGVIIGGMREPEVHALAEHATQTAAGPATLFGHGGSSSPAWAALVHGTAGTTLEMDEGHAFARGHAAIHAVPAALALGQATRASGREIMTAMVVGYEVAARAGVATRLRPEVHPFGTWGVLGAATVGAKYKGYDARGVAGTLELAASYAISPSFETAYQGANVRNSFAGLVNYLGLFAADLYGLGFRGERGALQTVFGHILGASFDPQPLGEELGKRYEMMRGYFKPYSACRYTHAAVDAVLALKAASTANISNISAIEVATYDIATSLNDPAPQTPLAGRFSLPYVVAATLIQGSAGPEIFAPDLLADPAILALAAKVTVVEEKAFTAMTPARRPARVKLIYQDGHQQAETVTGSKGDPDQPMSNAELEMKFLGLVSPTVGPGKAQQTWQELGALAETACLDGLWPLLVPTT